MGQQKLVCSQMFFFCLLPNDFSWFLDGVEHRFLLSVIGADTYFQGELQNCQKFLQQRRGRGYQLLRSEFKKILNMRMCPQKGVGGPKLCNSYGKKKALKQQNVLKRMHMLKVTGFKLFCRVSPISTYKTFLLYNVYL